MRKMTCLLRMFHTLPVHGATSRKYVYCFTQPNFHCFSTAKDSVTTCWLQVGLHNKKMQFIKISCFQLQEMCDTYFLDLFQALDFADSISGTGV